MGDCKSPQGWSNLFRRRISNPPERLTDCKFAGTPNGVYPYALKGQKLLAQGTALGIINGNLSPCKGKSFEFASYFKAFALTGRIAPTTTPRAVPWAGSFCPFRAYGFLRN